jgi:hypothetical protein
LPRCELGPPGFGIDAQVPLQEAHLMPQQPLGDGMAHRLMTDTRQEQHLVRAPGRQQRAGHPQRTHRIDIGIRQAVHQQQRPGQHRRRPDQREGLVPLGEQVGMTEEPLAPVRVVEPLVSDARADYGDVEDIRPVQHRPHGERAPERPAADADPAQVKVRVEARGLLHRGHLVFDQSAMLSMMRMSSARS